MSCLDGVVLAAYAAGELAPLARRDADAHLVRCRDCRARVLALRETLAPDGEPADAAPLAAPERGFALGFSIALAAVVLALAAVGRRGDFSLIPLSGVYGMAFDLLLWVRGNAPGLLELVAALAATASVATIAALVVASLARRIGPPLALVLWIGGGLAGPAEAFELRHAEAAVRVAADEVVQGSLVASADEVEVDGRVEGDLVVVGERVRIAGTVAGNVFALARDLEISGRIGGSLHAASERLRVAGEIGGSGYLAGELVRQEPGARIARDAYLFARRAELRGVVSRDLFFRGDALALGGAVARDVRVRRATRVELLAGAAVGRDLRAAVPSESDLVVAADGRIGGTQAVAETSADVWERFWRLGPWLWMLVRVAAALAFGVALYAVLPGLFWTRVPTASSFLRLLGIGVLALATVPLVVILLAVTLIGLPLALLGVFVYLTALYLAHVMAAAELGRTLLRRTRQDLAGLGSFARILLVGLTAVALAGQVPVLGPAVRMVILLVGAGLLADQVRVLVRSPRAA